MPGSPGGRPPGPAQPRGVPGGRPPGPAQPRGVPGGRPPGPAQPRGVPGGRPPGPARPPIRSATASFDTSASLYLTWTAATLAGAIGAGKIGSPQSFGLDVIGPAAFLALIWPRLAAGWSERGVAVGGAAIAIAATPLLPPGAPIVLAAFAALAGTLAGPPAITPLTACGSPS